MISWEEVLIAIVECRKENGFSYYNDIFEELEIDDISILPFLKVLREKGYIIQTTVEVQATSAGLLKYKELKNNDKNLINKFSIDFLKKFCRIVIEIIVGIAIAFLVYYFGWQ